MQGDYCEHVAEAATFIEARLTDELSLQEVAEHVGYSVFHFARLFQGMTGESVMDYVRKRRLTMAAGALVQSSRRILDIAVEYQYDSQEAFTRSFKRAYGITPGGYRRRGSFSVLCFPLTLPMLLAPIWKGPQMEPKIIELNAMTVVGLAYLGKNENMEIPALWDAFNPRCMEVQHKTQPNTALGVCCDMQPDGSFSYIAGFQVDAATDIPDGMTAKQIPAAKYAVFTHRGPLFGVENDLMCTYAYIYREWLPKSGYQRAETPDFELYDERFTFGGDGSEMDIFIPIK